MVGNRVRVILDGGRGSISGVLHKLDASGAFIYRDAGVPEAQGTVFLPMHRICEIVDLGRS